MYVVALSVAPIFHKAEIGGYGPPLSRGRRMRLNARPCPTAIASKSFKPAKIYSLKLHCSSPVARRNNDADCSRNRASVVVAHRRRRSAGRSIHRETNHVQAPCTYLGRRLWRAGSDCRRRRARERARQDDEKQDGRR